MNISLSDKQRKYSNLLQRRKRAEEYSLVYKSSYVRAMYLLGASTVEKVSGVHLMDQDGRCLVDAYDSFGNLAFGYDNPELIDTLVARIKKGNLHRCKLMFDDEISQLYSSIKMIAPDLPVVHLTNGGAEAIDSAIKLARGITKRPKILVAEGAYHGMTIGALSAGNRAGFQEAFGPLLPEITAIPFGDISALEDALDDTVAAILIETLPCEGGIRVASNEFYKAVGLRAREAGALLVLDEIQTGFGRSGKFFAFERLGAEPDIVCIGKSFGGGLLPISAVLAKKESQDVIDKYPLAFSSSLAGNPLALAVGRKAIEIASRPQFLENISELEEYISEQLLVLKCKYDSLIDEVNGIGLLWGVKLKSPVLTGTLLWCLGQEGVLTTFTMYDPSVIRIEPPLIITRSDLEVIIHSLDRALQSLTGIVAETRFSEDLFHIQREWEVPGTLDLAMNRLIDVRPDLSMDDCTSEEGIKKLIDIGDCVMVTNDEQIISSNGRNIQFKSISGDWKKI